MKTRFKIIVFLSCVAVFYFSLIPLTFSCVSLFDDCVVLSQLLIETRITISGGSSHIWDTGHGVGAWSDTVHGTEEESESPIRIERNIGFIVFVMFVVFICLMIYLVDKKRIMKFNS